MAISDEERHQLHNQLDEAIGPEAAQTLMTSLPPNDWSDFASKDDLAVLSREMDLRFQVVDHRLDSMDHRLHGKDQRLDRVELRLDRVESELVKLGNRVSDGLTSLGRELHSGLRSNLIATMTLMIALFGALLAAMKV